MTHQVPSGSEAGLIDAKDDFDDAINSVLSSSQDAEAPAGSEQPASQSSEPTIGDTAPDDNQQVVESQEPPENPAQQQASDDDPLSGSEPLTYDINGQQKAAEWAYRFPGEGVMIPEEHVSKFQSLLGKSELLETASRDYESRFRVLEALTTHEIKNADGSTSKLSFEQGLEAREYENVGLRAEYDTLVAWIKNPENLRSLVRIEEDENGNYRSVHNTDALEFLIVSAENARLQAERSVKERFSGLIDTANNPSVSFDIGEQAPVYARAIVEQVGVKGLTDIDVDFIALALQDQRYLRPWQKGDPDNLKGQMVYTDLLVEKIKNMASTRAPAAPVKAADDAQKFNQAQLAKRTTQVKPATVPKTAPKEPQRPKTRGEHDDELNNAVNQAMADLGIN